MSALNTATLLKQLREIDPDTLESDPDARYQALQLSRKLSVALDDPLNQAVDLAFKPYATIAARIAVGLDLFTHISSSLPSSVSSEKLALETKGEEVLISRVLRLLASVGFVDEASENEWKANDITKAMASAPVAAGHRFVFDILIKSAMTAPKFLSETGYKSPTEPTDGFVQYANQTKYNIFDYLATIPSLFNDFNLFMGNTLGARKCWHEWYDVRGRLISGYEGDGPLVVDVGGGKGHDMVAFHDRFSPDQYPGSLILQDLPVVLNTVKQEDLRPNIIRQEQDFFEPQRTKGARAYFLHHILHDWFDKYCHVILKQLRDAMTPGYSKLLIHELILPDVGAVEVQARYDLTMMTFNGGMERSRAQWTKLLQDAGFGEIQLFEHYDADGIVEAMVVA